MSSSENESDNDGAPNGAECLNRCKEFAEVTNTDRALAMFYLQDVKWDLQKALDVYYNATKKSNKKVVACFDIDQLNKDEELAQERLRIEAEKNKEDANVDDKDVEEVKNEEVEDREAEEEDEGEEEEKPKRRFKILSWNIDGLDSSSLESRTRGVISVIAKEEPDLIFFQEVISASYKILKSGLESNYEFVYAKDNLNGLDPRTYFTMILINKDTCKLECEKEIIEFHNTQMSRNLLKTKVIYKNKVKILAMTTHLESTAEFSKERIDQLKLCLNEMLKEKNDYHVLFGGDLNLRDPELEGIGGLPKNIHDLWQSTGSRKECLYTWDCLRNHNLTWNGKFKPRCRFDRLFYRKCSDEKQELQLIPVYFELEGLEKLKTCSRFCSDHWAIQCYFDLKSFVS